MIKPRFRTLKSLFSMTERREATKL
jgi:hypothetical protein